MFKPKHSAVKSAARPKAATLPVEMASQAISDVADTQISCVLPCPYTLEHIPTMLSFEITFKIFCNLSRSNSSLLAGLDFVAVAQAAASVCLESGVVALMKERC